MAIEKMKMVTIAGHLENLNEFIVNCCLDGRVQTEPAISHISSTMGFTLTNEENKYADRLSAVNEMASTLGNQLHLLYDGDFVHDDESTDNEYLDKLSSIIKENQDRKAKINTDLEQCSLAISNLSHFVEMNIPLNDIIACTFIKFRFGHMPKQSVEKLDLLHENPYLLFFPCSTAGNDVWGVYFAPLEQSTEIDLIFSSLFFERLRIPNSYNTPEKAVAGYQSQKNDLEEELIAIDASIQKIWQEEENSCNQLYTRLVYGNAIQEVRSKVALFHDSFYYVGWVPAQDYSSFEASVHKTGGIDWTTDDAESLDKSYAPPTKLKNNRLFKPFESFIEMYGLPNYKEFDPSTVFGIMYVLIFGIMFADVGQGFVVALGGFLLGKLKNSDLGKIFFRCGLSSMGFGVLFGSVFGFENALNWFYQLFGMAGRPINILDSALGIILMGVYMGVGLIYFFMGLNIYKCVKQRRFGRALFSESGLAGMLTYSGGVILIAQFLNKKLHLLPTAVCIGLLIGGLVLLFIKEWCISKIDKEPLEFENAGDYIITNLVELLEYIISYFTNTLSFLRVGSFVMVHAVMMNVVFTLAPDPNSNLFAFILVVVVGNIIVASLECLLTYIQVLRLGFYEMFSRFYEGDGEEFKAIHLTDKLHRSRQ